MASCSFLTMRRPTRRSLSLLFQLRALGSKDFERAWGFRVGDQIFETVEQVQPTENGDKVRERRSASLFESFKRRKPNTGFFRELHLCHGCTLWRHAPSPQRPCELESDFFVGEVIDAHGLILGR